MSLDSAHQPARADYKAKFWHMYLGKGRVTVAVLVRPRPEPLAYLPFGIALASPKDCPNYNRALGRRIAEGRARAVIRTEGLEKTSQVGQNILGDYKGFIPGPVRDLHDLPFIALDLLELTETLPTWARRAIVSDGLSIESSPNEGHKNRMGSRQLSGSDSQK